MPSSSPLTMPVPLRSRWRSREGGRVAWGGIFSLLPSAAVDVAVDDVCRANEKSRGRERLPISVAVDNTHRQVTRTPSD